MKPLNECLNSLKNETIERYSPCESCYYDGIIFDENNSKCKKCSFYNLVCLVKIILNCESGCETCKFSDWDKSSSCWFCTLEKESYKNCNNMQIDWKKVYEEYKNY